MTIYDVAARAGVGIATVSRALRGSAPVADATRAKVLAAVEELGFRPSHAGTSLAARTHAANGIVFPDLSGPYYAEVLLGYEEAASRLGRSVLVLATHGRADPAPSVRDLAGRVDGLVLLGRTVSDHVIEQLSRGGLPVVVVARPEARRRRLHPRRRAQRPPARSASTWPGTASAGSRSSGRPRSPPTSPTAGSGVREGLGAHGIEPTADPVPVRRGLRARASRPRLLAARDRPDALVCANDEIALGAIVAAEELGLRVGRGRRHHRLGRRHGRAPRPSRPHHRPPADARARGTRRRGARPAHHGTNARRRGTSRSTTDLVVRDSCGTHP